MKKSVSYVAAGFCLVWGLQSGYVWAVDKLDGYQMYAAAKVQKSKDKAAAAKAGKPAKVEDSGSRIPEQKQKRAEQKSRPVSAYMKRHDLNKNGKIDPQEKHAIMKDREARYREILKRFDKNGDGVLDAQERAVVQFD